MLSARRKSGGVTVLAYFEKRSNGPFACLDCGEEVLLRAGRSRVTHFAHADPLACLRTTGEGEVHRRCKLEIYEALRREPSVTDVALESPLGPVRPDIIATIRGT